MKRILMMAVAAALMCGCEKAIDGAESESLDGKTKKFTFTVKGDYGVTMSDFEDTRGYLSENAEQLTDLWLFDYMGGECVQTIHQSSTDENFGVPTLTLAYGTHHIYFVASRGQEPTVTAASHKISWVGPRDTFWKDYEVTVVNTSNGNRAVTLDRVATRLRVTVNDEIPTGAASIVITPATWYYGLDYVSGEPTDVAASQNRVVSIPSQYVGTSGQLVVGIFGMCGASQFSTNVGVAVKNAGGDVLGAGTITGAPFKRNRTTDCAGSLFSTPDGANVSVDSSWDDDYAVQF